MINFKIIDRANDERRDVSKILERIVQVGVVHAVNNSAHIARVKFERTGIISDWLTVLDNRPYIPDYDENPQHTESAEGGSGEPAYEEHEHDLIIKQWMPKIGAKVLVLYFPIWNSDGFILGGINR